MPNLLVSVGRDKPQHCSGTSSVLLQLSSEIMSYIVNFARGRVSLLVVPIFDPAAVWMTAEVPDEAYPAN
jgi:hypothetical protein